MQKNKRRKKESFQGGESRMRYRRLGVFVLILAVCQARSPVYDDDDEDGGGRSDQHVSTVPLEHSLSGDEWTARGTLTYTGPKLVTTKSKRLVSVQIEQSKFSSDDLHKLQKLVDEGRPYRIRIQSNVNDGKSAKVMASIPACFLIASNFKEIMRVHVDQYGHIRGVWYQTMSTECPKSQLRVPSSPSVQLVTSVTVDMESKGTKLLSEPVPKVIQEQKVGEERQKDGGSFIQKYWYYIIAGLILMTLMGGDDKAGPPGGPSGGGGGGGGGGGAARGGR